MEVNINSEIKRISAKYTNYIFYLFGSFIVTDKKCGDIDILIIYETTEHINSIRNDFKNITTFEHFDLMFLSFDEEKELKFIEKAKAIRL
jgi:predicted nucleotidyltransferase